MPCVLHDRIERSSQQLLAARVLDRNEQLDPMVEVARHQIGAAEEEGALPTGFEDEEAAVLEESPEQRSHTDIVLAAVLSRSEGAGGAREDLDLRPRVGCCVQLGHDLLVGEMVDLQPNARLLVRFGGFRAGANVGDDRLAHIERRDESLPEPLWPAEARQVVEEVREVGRDLLVGSEEAEVLVEAGGYGVVVAGSDVSVAPQSVFLTADDERALRVDLERRKSVDDVNARRLEGSRPLDVAALIEARLELDQADG